MRGLLESIRRLGDHVLGINARNLEVIYPFNPRPVSSAYLFIASRFSSYFAIFPIKIHSLG